MIIIVIRLSDLLTDSAHVDSRNWVNKVVVMALVRAPCVLVLSLLSCHMHSGRITIL